MSATLLRKGVVHPERERMEERSLRQCEGDWRDLTGRKSWNEKERGKGTRGRTRRSQVDEREKDRVDMCEENVRVRARRKEGHGRETVFVIKGAIHGAAAAWKKVSLPRAAHQSGTVRCHECTSNHRFSACRCHVILPRSPHASYADAFVHRHRVQLTGRLRNTSIAPTSDTCETVRSRSVVSIGNSHFDRITCERYESPGYNSAGARTRGTSNEKQSAPRDKKKKKNRGSKIDLYERTA